MVGRLNPNWIGPTAPRGTSDNRFATTAFVTGGGAGPRIVLPSPAYPGSIFYVANNGSDATGTGTSSNPFLTPAGVSNFLVSQIDFGNQAVTVQAMTGRASFTSQLPIIPWSGGGSWKFDGANGTVSVSGGYAIIVSGGALPGPFTYQQALLAATSTASDPNSGRAVDIISPSTVHQGAGVSLGTCSSHQIFVGVGGFLSIDANYSIVGGGATHWNAGNAGLIFIQNSQQITLSGTPAYSGAFANASLGGTLFVGGQNFTGLATGQRFNSSLNGIIFTGGGGANYFPGNAAGSTSTGGQYS